MLLKCPECELQVSDRALICPHCGFPLKKDARPKSVKKTKDHKRLPNGFGQISHLKGRNLRNPFRAMVSVGKKPNGRPISKVLGFYETYNDAYTALIEYNRNPYDLDAALLVQELYDKWTESYFATLKSSSSSRTITSAWAYCDSVKSMKVKDIRARHIKGCMDGVASANMKSRVKSLWNLMLDFALEYEMVDKNYARTFSVSDDIINEQAKATKSHIAFTEQEMKTLWDNTNINYVDIILIQCYTGFRPQELGLIKLENVDLENKLIKGGMKTPAGINRTVPIHDKIYDFVKFRYDEAIDLKSEYLLNTVEGRDLKLTYDKYSNRFEKIMDVLDMEKEHRPHDPRKTFVTKAKDSKMDEYAIKYIVGHAIDDITERIYTERKDEWLIEELKKIRD